MSLFGHLCISSFNPIVDSGRSGGRKEEEAVFFCKVLMRCEVCECGNGRGGGGGGAAGSEETLCPVGSLGCSGRRCPGSVEMLTIVVALEGDGSMVRCGPRVIESLQGCKEEAEEEDGYDCDEWDPCSKETGKA